MLHQDRNDISEGIDVNKTNASKECDVCHYRYFLNYSFQFQPNVCKCLNDLLMFVNFSDIAILNVLVSKKRFDSKSTCNEKYLKAKIKFYNGKINTNFHKNKI